MLIDVTRLLNRFVRSRLPTGIDRVILAYLQHYKGRAQAVIWLGGRFLILSIRLSEQLFELLITQNKISPVFALRVIAHGILTLEHTKRKSGEIFMNLGHSGLDRQDYKGRLRANGLRPVFMVHDLIPITHHEFCRDGERELHILRMRTVIETASGIVANSIATLEELYRFARTEGKKMPPAISAPLASGLTQIEPDAPPIAKPYFVMVGTIEPRKNHWLMLQVWRRLEQCMGTKTPLLVIIGQRGWECENIVDLIERCEQLKGFVIEISQCEDKELSAYMRHSRALLFPSFIEGYGIPMIEALTFGVPVIASNIPVFKEIAGEIPDYLDPLDGLGWMETIMDYADDKSVRRNVQIKRITGFKSPTWAEHFAIVDKFIEKLNG